MSESWKRGGCHCGAVKWESLTDDNVTVQECNCSICSRTGFQHLIIPAANFRLLEGESQLTPYSFNTKTARHLFCKHCGVKSFYVPRSNPDGYSLNLRCMDRSAFNEIVIEPFDGRRWEENGARMAEMSRT